MSYVIRNNAKKNWWSARAGCESEGLDLARVTNANEDLALKSALSGKAAWMGLNDLQQEGRFTWTDNGQQLAGYTNFKVNHPNNRGGNEHCVIMNQDGNWNDVDCGKEYFYACMQKRR